MTICVNLILGFLLFGISLLYWRHRKKLISYAEQIRKLTAEEIDEFYKGACATTTGEHENALMLPYNPEYEISWDELTLDDTVLGAGQFGVVLKGSIGDVPVAVKTIKWTAHVIYFKSLLSELKVLQFVGSHPNIANLIGANTSNIGKREVFLILDFCSNGCLVTLLRNFRSKFINLFDSSADDVKSLPICENTSKLTTISLLQFAKEVAYALEYLFLKNVIHGDLAARNILVTEDLHAKIGDFGLSKQLLHYTVYVQKVDCPLPVRWMAPESLQDMEFSLASDKWSFGIVLWEIFSLGETPYPGHQWNFESYRMLQEGYRMGKPKYANDSIHEIMLALWNGKPQERPPYEYIISQLKKEEEMLTRNKPQINLVDDEE